MNPLKKRNMKRNPRRGGKRRAPQATQNQFRPYSVYPRIPTEMNVKLRYQLQTSAVPAAGATIRNYFGLFQYLNRKPLYSNELFAMYDRARVTAIRCRFELIVTGTIVPADITMVSVPYNEVSTITATQAKERHGAIFKTAGLATGMSRVTLTKSYNSQREMGNSVDGDYNRWMDSSSASSIAPVDTYEPVVLLIASPSDATSAFVAIITIQIDYDVQYFNLKTPALSFPTLAMIEKPGSQIDDESMEETFIKVVKPKK